MVDGAANLMSLFYAFLSTGQWKDQRHSNLLDGSAPFYRCYTCRDGGHVAVGALEPQFFAILLGPSAPQVYGCGQRCSDSAGCIAAHRQNLPHREGSPRVSGRGAPRCPTGAKPSAAPDRTGVAWGKRV